MTGMSVKGGKMLNRLLRRVDWRFLTSNPQPAKSICFTKGLLADAVALISDQIVAPHSGQSSECDLAVGINPARETLQEAWIALRPGGTYYSEWYSPFTGGAEGVRRRLEKVGFTDIVCYWPWPWPDG